MVAPTLDDLALQITDAKLKKVRDRPRRAHRHADEEPGEARAVLLDAIGVLAQDQDRRQLDTSLAHRV